MKRTKLNSSKCKVMKQASDLFSEQFRICRTRRSSKLTIRHTREDIMRPTGPAANCFSLTLALKDRDINIPCDQTCRFSKATTKLTMIKRHIASSGNKQSGERGINPQARGNRIFNHNWNIVLDA